MKTKEQEKQEEINSIKNLEYTINPELNKYDDIIMFPEKLRKAKETIAKHGLPKAYYEQMAKQNAEKEKK